MIEIIDPQFFDRIQAALLPSDAKLICDLLAPGWLKRRRRMDERDDAIRLAANILYAGLKPTVAAERLAVEMGRYLASAWRSHKTGLPADASPIHAAFYQFAKLNGGNGIGERQIQNILDSHRGR